MGCVVSAERLRKPMVEWTESDWDAALARACDAEMRRDIHKMRVAFLVSVDLGMSPDRAEAMALRMILHAMLFPVEPANYPPIRNVQ